MPEYVYKRGVLDRTLPFAELRKRSLVNDRARAAGRAEDFSRRERAARLLLRRSRRGATDDDG